MTPSLSLRLPEDLQPWADESQFACIFWNLRVKDILLAKEIRIYFNRKTTSSCDAGAQNQESGHAL